MTASVLATLALLAPFAVHPAPASALPIFARRYGVSCQACHSIVPRLSAFGQAFKNSGYRWPAALTPAPTLPVAVRVNLAYSSLPDPTGLPKAIVDEVEALSAGPLGKHFSYYAEQYLVDGGRPGKTRDAYLEYLSDPMQAWKGTGGVGVRWEALAGQFTLPLPVDPETMRPTENHYAVFDQIVGDNPFNFFDPRIGIDVGAVLRDAELRVLFIKGHDPQSGLPTAKPDTMFAARLGSDRLALFGYAYLGTRRSVKRTTRSGGAALHLRASPGARVSPRCCRRVSTQTPVLQEMPSSAAAASCRRNTRSYPGQLPSFELTARSTRSPGRSAP